MSSRIYLNLRQVEDMLLNADGFAKGQGYAPYYEIYAFDDYSRCSEYIGNVKDVDLNEPDIQEKFTPGGAIAWLLEYQDEFSDMSGWALEHGMYILDDWHEPDELKAAYEQYEIDHEQPVGLSLSPEELVGS